MKREIYFPALGIVFSELMMFFGQVNIGLPIHIINLQLISLALIFNNFQSDIKKVLQSMILLILMRIISLVMPQFFTNTLFWYVLVNAIMFIPIYIIIKNQDISLNEIGINFKRFHIYLPIALIIGIDLAVLEFRILDPSALIGNIQPYNLVLIAIVMFVFIGAVEELIFRSILQTRLEKVIGLKKGLFLTAILFGIMHSVYGQINEILLATILGIIIGYAFQKTRSFPFILAINGTTNMVLFGILPILLK